MALLLLGSVGCAHLDIHKTDNAKDPNEYGLRFYRPRPYFLVTLSDKGCTPTIEYLPDYSQEYILHPYYWLGSLSFKSTLEHGWNLTAFDSAVDTKIPDTINALAGAMKNAAEVAAIKAGQMGGASTNFGPGLYSMTFDKNTGLLTKIDAIFQFTDEQGKLIVCPQSPPPKREK